MDNPMIQSIPKRRTREDILGLSASLFAQHGYDGVSMRDVAVAVRLTPAALYYHFSDKEQLYLDVVRYAFEEKAGSLKSLLTGEENPWVRLEAFIAWFTRMLAKEKDFRRLMQWVLLDSDEIRQKKLADCVFLDLFNALRSIAGELSPNHDTHMLVVSIIGLAAYPIETQSMLRFLPDYQRQHEDPEAIARHVISLVRTGLNVSGGGAY
jgi:AcrR family transcriptional regulator